MPPRGRARVKANFLLIALGAALLVGATAFWLIGDAPGDKVVTEVTDGGRKTTTTTGGAPGLSSESLVITLLVAGLVLLLAGALFDRLKKIGLPGGASIELDGEAQATLAGNIARHTSDADKAKEAYEKALERIADDYWGRTPNPPADYLEQVGGEVVKEIR
jgi:hypothetical protein